jgi:hypothetical protein
MSNKRNTKNKLDFSNVKDAIASLIDEKPLPQICTLNDVVLSLMNNNGAANLSAPLWGSVKNDIAKWLQHRNGNMFKEGYRHYKGSPLVPITWTLLDLYKDAIKDDISLNVLIQGLSDDEILQSLPRRGAPIEAVVALVPDQPTALLSAWLYKNTAIINGAIDKNIERVECAFPGKIDLIKNIRLQAAGLKNAFSIAS